MFLGYRQSTERRSSMNYVDAIDAGSIVIIDTIEKTKTTHKSVNDVVSQYGWNKLDFLNHIRHKNYSYYKNRYQIIIVPEPPMMKV